MLLLLSVLFISITVSTAFDTNSYANKVVLSDGTKNIPKYTLYWYIDGSTAHFGFAVQTTGWFGFGIAEVFNGGMPGSDIVTVRVTHDGGAEVFDRHAVIHDTPIIDLCQNWNLVSASVVGDFSYVELTRSLDTGDSLEDRVIGPGQQPVVFSIGQPGATVVVYHGAWRGKGLIVFFPGTYTLPIPPSDVRQIRMPTNTKVPTQDTWYQCYSFHLPTLIGNNDFTHITAFELQVGNGNVIHHAFLRRCVGLDSFWQHFKDNPGDNCLFEFSWQNISLQTTCYEPVYGWALGATKWELPMQVGLPASQMEYVLLEIHYNNVGNIVYPDNDTTTLVIDITQKDLRKYSGSAILGADPSLLLPPIPPLQTNFQYHTACRSECMMAFPDVTVFAVILHSHSYARTVGISIYRDGKFYKEIAMLHFFSLHNQNAWNVPLVDLRTGDEISYTCTYDTTGTTQPVRMGDETADEMCSLVLYWYPVLAPTDPALKKYPLGGGMPACGYWTESQSLCGGMPMATGPYNGTAETLRIANKPLANWGFPPPGYTGECSDGVVAVFNILVLVVCSVVLFF